VRKVIVSYLDSAPLSSLSSSSSSSEAISEGGFLDGETLEPLLAAVPIQRLAFEGLPDLTLLCDIFLFLLLSRRKASHLSSDMIFRDRWPRVLDC
jgi:hypothetical protein